MKTGNFPEALDNLLSLIDDQDSIALNLVLQGITEIQNNGFNLSNRQLQKVKPLMDMFDEDVEELAIKIYINAIKNSNLIQDELEFTLSKLKSFEPIIRGQLVSFLIEIFPKYPVLEEKILEGLIKCLSDDLWNIRMKIIEFLNDIFLEKIDIIINFKNELEIILEETDIDVLREGLDFLLRLYDETYSIADIRKLVKNIPQKNWNAQEKILYLIGKLGIKRKDLIIPIRKELVKLLDFNDYLVNNETQEVIEELLEYHPNLFDDVFFAYIRNDIIDNIGAIESLLRNSIITHGFIKFYSLFKNITDEGDQLIKPFNNIVSKMLGYHPALLINMFRNLIGKILKDLNYSDYKKLEMTLASNPHYDLYKESLEALNENGKLTNTKEEKRRIDLIRFLWENIPEFGFIKFSAWLNSVLKHDSIELEAICEKFNIQHQILIHILKKLVYKGLLNSPIEDDLILSEKSTQELKNDLIISKDWKTIQKRKEDEVKIKFTLHLKNNSGKIIENLQTTIFDPYQILVVQEIKKEKNYFPPQINHNQELELNWILKKYRTITNSPIASLLMIFVFYEIQGKLSTRNEAINILLL